MIRTAPHSPTIRTGPADLDLPFALALAVHAARSEAGTVRAPELPAASRARRRNTTRRRRTAATQS